MSTIISPGSSATQAIFVVRIKDIKCQQLPDVGWPKRQGNFYVKLMLDGHFKHKTIAIVARGNSAAWTESFYIDAIGSSVFECQIYAHHKFGSDDFIGGTSNRIEVLLTEGATGVVTRKFGKSNTHKDIPKTLISVEFLIVAINTPANAANMNMNQALDQGKDTFNLMQTAPSLLGCIQEANDISTVVLDNAKFVAGTWDTFIEKLKMFTDIMDKISGVHPYANMAWSILSAIHKIIITQYDRDNYVGRLVEVMNDVYSFVQEAEPIKKVESNLKIIELIEQQTTECAYFIRDYAVNKNFWTRTLKNSFGSTVDSTIKHYEDKFKELKTALQDHTSLQTSITVSRVLDNLQILTMDFDFSDMPYAKGARFDATKGCLPGTRKEIIKEICEWVNNPNGKSTPRIFLLTGVAGSGKSSIAHTIAQSFNRLGRLGSSYCFDRADQVNRRPSNLFVTIALDMADLDCHCKTSLCNVVKGNRSLRTTLAATEQFESLILEPSRALTTIGPVVLVIDAIDESGDEASRKAILDVLAKRVSDLLLNFRVLITARPEQDIVDAFDNNRHGHVFRKRMDTIDDISNESDLTIFIEAQLSGIRSLELEWPNNRWCRMLMESSGGHFQWASTACHAIKNHRGALRPTERLSRFLSAARGLDELYSEVLGQAFDVDDFVSMSRFKLVMGRILATKEPLSISAHSELRDDDDPADLVELIVSLLGPLMCGVDQQDVPLRALHASFLDFLTDESRSKSYFVNPSQHNRSLALSSLRVMESELRFNICGLETSNLRNADVLDLVARVEKFITPHLSYGCRFWINHLVVTAYDPKILYAINNFLHSRLLYWLEVMSFTNGISIASRMLLSLLEWSQNENEDMASFVKDAVRFVAVFGPPISQSVPHIYLSAIPFAPKKSLVAQHYLPQLTKTLCLETGSIDNWPVGIAVFEGHTDEVRSCALSQDNKRIVSCSNDKTIRVWDADSGVIVVGPLQGHADVVNCVSFSPDGRRIISGSGDRTIRIWDAENGDVVRGPLKGHKQRINSVAFSQGGNRIASGSDDRTIRIWDVETGKTIMGPLRGHADSVTSVAFSPDGMRIVSGSQDWTIRFWDAETGAVVLGPLKGHTFGVMCVAFTHDGKRIVSGANDGTIRVWNAQTGDIVLGPLLGHAETVDCVAFSPDGQRIVSGSFDRTIRVWDAETGALVMEPLEGHTYTVNSVTFTQDGKRIVSCANDRTIRIWDAEPRDPIGQLDGHTDWVEAATFSQDGKRIVSGSWDKTVRVWDAETGDTVMGSLQGHTDYVKCVAFSRDRKRIVSGSDDKTIRVWNAETGNTIVRLLQTSSVNSVAFSPDGKHILCGTCDDRIRVWDIESRAVVVGPLQGRAPAFSHDGKCIVSSGSLSSGSRIIHIWDAETGNTVGEPLRGHTNVVASVAFSHDNKCIVSGSFDWTIRVWDADNGSMVLGPLHGHTDAVTSVAFSQDSKRIVSASHDQTIRIWSAETGNVIIGPLEGHTYLVLSVAYSQDGRHVVSGSSDHTIRVWDVENGDIIVGPPGHAGSVISSEDRKCVVPSETSVSSVFDDSPEIKFRDSSRLDGGWILDSSSHLLFWVPHWNRTGLWRPRNSLVIGGGAGGLSTRLDLRNFVYGDSWWQCGSSL